MPTRLNKAGWLEVPLYEWADGEIATLVVEPKPENPIEIHFGGTSRGKSTGNLGGLVISYKAGFNEAPFFRMKGIDRLRFGRMYGNFNEEKKVRGLLLDLRAPRRMDCGPVTAAGRSLARYSRWPNDGIGGLMIGMAAFVPDECLSVIRLLQKLNQVQDDTEQRANHSIQISKEPKITLSIDIYQALSGTILKIPEIPQFLEIRKKAWDRDWRMTAEEIVRALRVDHAILPMSAREKWNRENIETGEPIAISREELSLFEAIGSPNPIWWDSLGCYKYFAEKGGVNG